MKSDGVVVENHAAKPPDHPLVARFAAQLYEHVFRTIDFRRLHGLEEHLGLELIDTFGLDRGLELARELITDLLTSAIADPRRYFETVPYGISNAERFAAVFEEDCAFCAVDARDGAGDPARADRRRGGGGGGDDDGHEEDCACCAMLVRDWRAQHAEALRRFGLGPAARTSKLQPPVRPATQGIAAWPTKLTPDVPKA